MLKDDVKSFVREENAKLVLTLAGMLDTDIFNILEQFHGMKIIRLIAKSVQ